MPVRPFKKYYRPMIDGGPPLGAALEGSQCGVRAGSGFEDMGQTGVQVDLNEDGNSKDRNHNGLRQKLFALEAEEQHQCRQQSH